MAAVVDEAAVFDFLNRPAPTRRLEQVRQGGAPSGRVDHQVGGQLLARVGADPGDVRETRRGQGRLDHGATAGQSFEVAVTLPGTTRQLVRSQRDSIDAKRAGQIEGAYQGRQLGFNHSSKPRLEEMQHSEL